MSEFGFGTKWKKSYYWWFPQFWNPTKDPEHCEQQLQMEGLPSLSTLRWACKISNSILGQQLGMLYHTKSSQQSSLILILIMDFNGHTWHSKAFNSNHTVLLNKKNQEEEAEVLNSWMSKSHIVSMCVFPIDPLTLITYWYCIGCYLRMMAGYANAWLLLLPPYTFSIVSWVTQWFLNDVILRRARPRRSSFLSFFFLGGGRGLKLESVS